MAEKSSTPKIRVGPAGWSYKDWIGIVYGDAWTVVRRQVFDNALLFLPDRGSIGDMIQEHIIRPRTFL